MNRDELVAALELRIPRGLAVDLVDSFLTIRRDVASATLGRTAPGKFVETVVQILQHLATGNHDTRPNVDAFLRDADNKAHGVDDGLRVCAARVGRSMYSLRNKRSIAHKGEVDPNTYDLSFLLAGAQWILAELLRQMNGISMVEAGRLVDQVQAPVGGMVEDFGKRRLVHGDLTMREEVVVLLHSHYPDTVAVADIVGSLDRRSPGGVRNKLRQLWSEKLLKGTAKTGYRLTRRGLEEAVLTINSHLDPAR